MRVLFVVHGLPPDAAGGTEIYADALAHALARGGQDTVAVLAADADPSRPDFDVRRESGGAVEVIRVNNTFRTCGSFEDTYRPAAIRAIAGPLLDRFRPDVVHVHHLTRLSIDILHECAARGIVTVFTLPDYWLLCHRGQLVDVDYRVCAGPEPARCARCFGFAGAAGNAPHRLAAACRRLEPSVPAVARIARRAGSWLADADATGRGIREAERRLRLMRAACDAVTLFLAPSAALAARFVEFGVDPARIRPWNPGIDLTGFHKAGRAQAGPIRFGFLGSLMITKGPDLLLRAFGRLPAGGASLSVFGGFTAYHGDDRFHHVLRPLLDAPGVMHADGVARQSVPDALASLDVLVVPSTWPENSPFVIREAFAAGLPVVASRVGGIPALVEHEVNGLLFEPGDEDALVGILRRFLDEPQLLERLRRGVPRVKSIEEDARDTRAVYGELLERQRGGAQKADGVRDSSALRRSGCGAGPESCARPHAMEASRPAVSNRGRLAAVVVNYGTAQDTLLAVRSLQASDRTLADIIVVDNGGSPDSTGALDALGPGVHRIRLERNLGFSGGNNVGIREALDRGANQVLLVNSDVIVPPDVVARLEQALGDHRTAGIAGPVILARHDPERVICAGISVSMATGRMHHLYFGRPLARLGGWFARQRLKARRSGLLSGPLRGTGEASADLAMPSAHAVDVISGCVMLVDAAVFRAIGLLEEAYFYSFEDLDFCLTARQAGFSSVLVTDAFVYHEGCRSIGARSPRRLYFAARNHLLMFRRVASAASPPARWCRAAAIVGMHLAHAVIVAEAPLVAGVRHVLTGVRDHVRERYGDPWAPAPSEASASAGPDRAPAAALTAVGHVASETERVSA